MKRLKSIEELRKELSSFDYAFVSSETLAKKLALVNVHTVDSFIEKENGSLLSEDELVRELFLKTKKPFAYLVQLISELKKKGKLDDVKILDEILSFESLISCKYNYEANDFFEGKCVAVVGTFDSLDKKVIPSSANPIDVFTEDEYSIGEINLASIKQKAALFAVDRVLEYSKTGKSSCIVTSNDMVGLLKAKILARSDVSKTSPLGFGDLIVLAEKRQDLGALLVVDMLPYAKMLEGLDPRKGNHLFVNSKLAKPFVGCVYYKDLFKFFEYDDELISILKSYGLLDMRISARFNQDLVSIFDFVEKRSSSESELPMVYDCRDVEFLEEENFVFLGLDESWSKCVEPSLVLQQGQEKCYVAFESASGDLNLPLDGIGFGKFRDVDSVFDIDVELKDLSFRDYRGVKVKRTWDQISPTSLSRFLMCPKKLHFAQLDYSQDVDAIVRGNLIHDFAAFYLMNSSFVHEKGNEYFADIMFNEYAQVASSANKEISISMFLVAIYNVCQFIDQAECSEISFGESITDNFFLNYFKMDMSSQNSEVKFTDEKFGLKGIVDFVINPFHLVDYKTGYKVYTAREIVKKSIPVLMKKDVDVQAITYLYFLQEYSPNKTLKFTYYFPLANQRDLVVARAPRKSSVEVVYHPFSFAEFLATDEFIRVISKTKKYKEFVAVVGQENIQEFFHKYEFLYERQFDINECTKAKVDFELASFLKPKLKFPLSSLSKDCFDFVKAIVNFRLGSSGTAYYFRDDLESYTQLVEKSMVDLNKCNETYFPCNPRSLELCDKCDHASVCLREYERNNEGEDGAVLGGEADEA